MVTLSRSLKINKNIEKAQKHHVKYLDIRDLFLIPTFDIAVSLLALGINIWAFYNNRTLIVRMQKYEKLEKIGEGKYEYYEVVE